MHLSVELIFYRRRIGLPQGMSPEEYLFWYSLPFVLAIVYLIYKFFRNRNRVMRWNDGRIPSGFEVTESNLAEVYIVFAASAAKRGRAYVRQKEELINKYLDEHFPEATCKVDESFDFAVWHSIDLHELIFWCSSKLNQEQKLQLFEFLVWICGVDHEIVDEEKELLLYVFGRFGLSLEALSTRARMAVEVKQEERVVPAQRSTRSRCLSALGLSENAGLPEIKKMYRLLVKQVHPDRHPNASPSEKQLLEARFQEIQEAYDFLMKAV